MKVESLSQMAIDHGRCAAIGDDAHEALARSQLRAGDVLVSIAGTLGRVALVKRQDLPANTNQALAIARPVDPDLAPYIALAVASPMQQMTIAAGRRGGGLQNLNLKQVAAFPVPLPSPAEAAEVVRVATRLLSILQDLTSTVGAALESAAHMDSAVLAKAFRGELTR